jgi:hypothetical protein
LRGRPRSSNTRSCTPRRATGRAPVAHSSRRRSRLAAQAAQTPDCRSSRRLRRAAGALRRGRRERALRVRTSWART